MKQLFFLALLFPLFSVAQQKVNISFFNDYKDVCHAVFIFYTPEGKSQIRVSDMKPLEIKTFQVAEGTEIYIADYKQEVFAMKGNDLKASGAKPYMVVKMDDNKRTIKLSAIAATGKVNPDKALGTWVIDLRPTPESEPYLKDFKFTKIDSTRFDGEFYGYPFSGGFLNTDWDKIYFAFTTGDQSGTYYHSGYIEGDKVYGMSLNENRKLMLPWRGERKTNR